MATVYGVTATAQYTGGLANKLGVGYINGRVKVYRDTYAADASASGTVIQVAGYGTTGYLPKGARIISIHISASVAQSSVTVSVGDLTSATRYASASTALQTAGLVGIFGGNDNVVGTSTGDNYILLTTGGASLGSTGTIVVDIFYTTD
jgi:hypothetical protein